MFSKLIGSECSLLVTTYPDAVLWYQSDQIGVHLSQWAANAETLKPPIPARECRYSVSFIGASYGNRSRMIDSLRGEGIDVACFGYGWPEGPVEAERIPEIIRSSQVSLNFSEGSQKGLGEAVGRQIKARVFEVTGSGGCLLTEQTPGLETHFRIGEEILTFEGPQELIASVKLLLADPERRDAIARRGFDRVCREHIYDHRFSNLLGELTRRVANRPRQSIDWPEFESAAGHHTFGVALRMLRSLLVMCASLIWGAQRGPRAARRFVFELSWRLVGARTYTAAGLPGRMFYRES
jgi:spore maturation protein CgeB